jgi:hypothetical protein
MCWLAFPARGRGDAIHGKRNILTNKAVVACHVKPLLPGVYGVVELHRLVCLEFALRVEHSILRQNLFVAVFVRFIMFPLLGFGSAIPIAALWLRDNGDGEGAIRTILVGDGTVGDSVVRSRARALSRLGTHRGPLGSAPAECRAMARASRVVGISGGGGSSC